VLKQRCRRWRRENGAVLGIGYERILNKSFGIGVIAEHTFGGGDFWVYAVPFAYRTDRLKFVVAPGIEDGEHGTEWLVRCGVEYAFEASSWEISPRFAVDFVDGEEVLILGVVFGQGSDPPGAGSDLLLGSKDERAEVI